MCISETRGENEYAKRKDSEKKLVVDSPKNNPF